jgi:aryl-alcohol dehydrogenase-like predicted oxidoreductase
MLDEAMTTPNVASATGLPQRKLGQDGPLVPVIGFGAWPIGGGMGQVDEAQAARTLHHALDSGVTLIDTAEAYRTSEEVIGRALRAWSGDRSRVFVATKVRGNDLSREHILAAAEQSLRHLQIERIDLLQAHSWDATHPIEESTRAFEDLVRAGKVRYVGVSNFDVPRMEAARAVRPFQSLQPRYNVFDSEADEAILPYCERQGIGVLAHSPLAKGLLTGRYRPGHVFPEDDERSKMARFQGETFARYAQAAERLEEWARERGHSLVELAIAWVLSHPAVTVCLCGAKSPEQVDEHVRAAGWGLTPADRAEVSAMASAARA